jgi:hypothetical protein
VNRLPLQKAQLLALAVCVGMGLAFAIANVRSWELEDAEAYWNAANRLRTGADLYVPVPLGADETIAYRYAPWLAWLWIPLTYLPKLAVQIGWSAVLLAAVGVALWPLARARNVAAWCLLFLLGGLMLRTASTGNVHALMIAALVWGTPRRSGAAWVGLAASIKIVPILFALVYAGRRQWGRLIIAVVVATLLWAPALLYDLRGYPSEPGESLSLLSLAGPVPWLILVAASATATLFLARTRFAWVAGAWAVVAAVPRLALYDLTYLLVSRDERASG